jgi:hypothetical protein
MSQKVSPLEGAAAVSSQDHFVHFPDHDGSWRVPLIFEGYAL